MPEETHKKRERPPKNPVVETNQQSSPIENIFENNSFTSNSEYDSIFNCGVYDYFSKEDIDRILRDPIGNHDLAIKLSEFVYTKNGIVTNSIDYMTALMCLDKIVYSKSKSKKADANKELMKSTMRTINDKSFIRNALFTDMTNGTSFFYFETTEKIADRTKFLQDYEVENIVEINSLGINASIITLPWQYTKIVGKKNGRYVLAFNLQYFDDFTGTKLENKLKKYPKEIVDGYQNKQRQGNWIVLDNNHTMCHKIKCKDVEPWGRSLVIAALSDILYKDYFIDTKRNALDELNNKVIYQTFPQGEKPGTCSLNKNQQEDQHTKVKKAVMTKNNKGGTSFFSVASGTKLDTIDTSTDIFDDKNESSLDSKISMDLGICASLIGAMSTGTFAGGQQNLEMIGSQLYTWVCEWQNELEFVINKNIIKDEKNKVGIYYFPTTFVNRKDFFSMMKDLYTTSGGSMTFLIASAGVDPDIYLATLDGEIENGFFEKYLPHKTSNQMSKDDNVGGRPETDSPSDSTVENRNIGGNLMPSASD